MKIEQGDIVEFYVETITSAPGPHPCIVISTSEVFEIEGYHYAVMLSTKSYDEDPEFEISPEMISSDTNVTCFAKTQLIIQFMPAWVTMKKGRLKKIYLRALLEHMNEEVFNFICQ